MTEDSEKTDSEDSVNISRLRNLATRGKEYREDFETTYIGEPMELVLQPVISRKFLPIAAALEDKMDMDEDEAQRRLEEEKESGEDSGIDPSQFDEEFVVIMSRLAVKGIDPTAGDAAGEDEEGLKEIFAISDSEDENIGLIGGVVLEIAERVLSISSDAEKAESFRRDGGGE